ncbi:MAG: hypothetical protein HDR04_06740 [Lachnospiraceae bacterium]|nr:hypothetical protein [Lachnospiraceae bacterium]
MFAAEMKKIWTFRSMLLIIFFSVLFFYSFLYQWIKPFRWEEDSLNVRLDILSDWIARYGNTIDQTEFEEIEDGYNDILYQAWSVIGENSYFEENGVEDYEDYLDYEQNAINGYEGYDYSVYAKMRSLIAENTGYSRIWFQEYENMMQEYRAYGKERNSILPFEVYVYTGNYLMYLAIWCLVCVFFIAAPVMVNDRENNIVAAQYSSRIGKKTYRMQYVCTMFSVFIVVSSITVIGMLAWRTTGVFLFAGSDMSSFLNTEVFAISVTYGKYIILFIIMVYLLALGVSGILFCLSAHSPNMTSMLLKAIPALAGGILIVLLLQNALCESNLIYRLTGRKYCEVVVTAVILTAGILLNLGSYKALYKKDC